MWQKFNPKGFFTTESTETQRVKFKKFYDVL
jgi:hypothetical protein